MSCVCCCFFVCCSFALFIHLIYVGFVSLSLAHFSVYLYLCAYMRVCAIVVVYCGVRMQTCVPYQYDDQLTLAINTPIFRSHDTYARLVTVAVDAATSMLFCFVVCVTDDGESEIGACKNINAIVNCINCTPLTTLAQVTNAHSKIDPNTNPLDWNPTKIHLLFYSVTNIQWISHQICIKLKFIDMESDFFISNAHKFCSFIDIMRPIINGIKIKYDFGCLSYDF